MGNWSECTELNYFVPLLIAVVQLLKKKKSPQKRSFFKVKFKSCFGETSVGTRCTDCVQAHVASLGAQNGWDREGAHALGAGMHRPGFIMKEGRCLWGAPKETHQPRGQETPGPGAPGGCAVLRAAGPVHTHRLPCGLRGPRRLTPGGGSSHPQPSGRFCAGSWSHRRRSARARPGRWWPVLTEKASSAAVLNHSSCSHGV